MRRIRVRRIDSGAAAALTGAALVAANGRYLANTAQTAPTAAMLETTDADYARIMQALQLPQAAIGTTATSDATAQAALVAASVQQQQQQQMEQQFMLSALVSAGSGYGRGGDYGGYGGGYGGYGNPDGGAMRTSGPRSGGYGYDGDGDGDGDRDGDGDGDGDGDTDEA